jgi:CRISPR/Cas system CSM-associated protein Csm3 (group 7 of RAMP superfamily)
MARTLSKRLTITGTLRAKQPLHVGGLADSVDTDMPLARNGLGELYVPGTSLAGVFRAWMERHFNDIKLLENLWGSRQATGGHKTTDTDTDTDTDSSASRLLIDEAKVTLPDELSEELWESISVERRWGVTANHQKFDYTILPRGSTLDLCLHLELPSEIANYDAMRAMLGYLLKALQAGQIRLGASTARGLGQIELISPKQCEVDWNRRTEVLKWLSDDLDFKKLDCDTLIKAAEPPLIFRRSNILHLTIDWAPVGPLMVKASYDGIAVDTLPLVSGVDAGKIALVLPGSSFKGALRTQAERIIRTLLNRTELPKEWLKQVEMPLVDYVFGTAKKGSKKFKQYVPGKGCLNVNTCYAKNATCTLEQWQQIETAQPSGMTHPLYDALNSAGLRKNSGPHFDQGFHLAIDRWTGSAAEGFLYSAIEPFGVKWEPIEISLDLGEDRLPSHLQAPALTLLLLLLHDLSDRRIPIGFNVNRGYGVVAIKHVTFQWEKMGDSEIQHWLDGVSLEEPFSLSQLPVPEMKKLQSEWQAWIKAQKESISV